MARRFGLYFLLFGACITSVDDELPRVEGVEKHDRSSVSWGLGLAEGFEVFDVESAQATLVSFLNPKPHQAPVIAGKEALLRVYVRTSRNLLIPYGIQARLRVWDGHTLHVLEQIESIHQAESRQDDLESTINFEVPAKWITPQTEIDIALFSLDGVSEEVETHPARFPSDGISRYPLGAQESGKLDLVLVPVHFEHDEKTLLPPVDQTVQDALRAHLLRLLPIADANLQISVRENPFVYEGSVGGLSTLLDETTRLRTKDRTRARELLNQDSDCAEFNAECRFSAESYYLSLIKPRETRDLYLAEELGYGGRANLFHRDDNTDKRTAIVVWYGDEQSMNSLVHELAHLHGQEHAPCNSEEDEIQDDYPWTGGEIGTWGYDPRNETPLIDPEITFDITSACIPYWISGFTYRAFHERMVLTN